MFEYRTDLQLALMSQQELMGYLGELGQYKFELLSDYQQGKHEAAESSRFYNEAIEYCDHTNGLGKNLWKREYDETGAYSKCCICRKIIPEDIVRAAKENHGRG